MAGKIFRYEELTATQLAELDREHTLVLMALSPLEVHGPHLPAGTDLLVALELQQRIMEQVRVRWPETDFLLLPPAYMGADTLPEPASVDVDSRALYLLLLATGRSLAGQGFRTMLLTDNHGGPRHQIAIEKAVRRLYRQYGFALIAPFNRFYRRMVERDPRLLAETGLEPGACGDDPDSHSGTNETSIMLVVAPGLILPLWKTLPRTAVPDEVLAKRLLGGAARLAGRLGAGRLGRDLTHLGEVLGWLAMKPMPNYMGDPAKASAEAGERMLRAHVAEAVGMLEEVAAGQPPFNVPVLWDLRFIEGSRQGNSGAQITQRCWTMSLSDYLLAMPKVELHVHLEGSIRPSTLLTLAERNGVPLPAQDLEGLSEFYRFTDFEHFIQVYMTVTRCLKTVADYSLIAYEFGADMARQNIRYAEVTFTPQPNVANTGLPFAEILAALNEGRSRAKADFGVEFRWVLDIVRNVPESRFQVAEWAAGAQDQGVVGFGLGGSEQGYPAEWFADAFGRALEAGLHSVPHAGETVGPESVWGAIHGLKAERLGHGVRSIEDPALVDYLAEHQIPLEICPTSNLCLGVYGSYEEHPIRRLKDAGVCVTVNSDDPPMFNTDLLREYQVLVEKLDFTPADLEAFNLNALRSSFLPVEVRADLERQFLSDFQQLRGETLD